jgi:hypothetical protein
MMMMMVVESWRHLIDDLPDAAMQQNRVITRVVRELEERKQRMDGDV